MTGDGGVHVRRAQELPVCQSLSYLPAVEAPRRADDVVGTCGAGGPVDLGLQLGRINF